MKRITALLDRMGLSITTAVGTMWCAIAFAALACVSLPDALRGTTKDLIAWIAQTFLQLVLLSVIMVGQRLQAAKVADHHEETRRHTPAHAKLLHEQLGRIEKQIAPKPARRARPSS